MKSLTKLTVILLSSCLFFCLAGCGNESSEPTLSSDRPSVKTDLFKTPSDSPEESETQPDKPQLPTHQETEAQTTAPAVEETMAITDLKGMIVFQGTEQEIFNQRLAMCSESEYALMANRFIEEEYNVTDASVITRHLLDSHNTYYTAADLSGYDETILWLMKNEIYARHGRTFENKKLQDYFMTRMWYVPTTSPDDFDESCFNDYEKKNLELLLELEKGVTPSGSSISSDRLAKAKNGRLLELEGDSWAVDLDGDGTNENIRFSTGYANYSEYYTLGVNQDSETIDAVSLVPKLYLTSMDGKTYQMMIFQYGFSDDPCITVWCWNGFNLVQAGYICSYLENVYISDGILYCQELSNIIQTIYVDMKYELDGCTLKVIKDDFYPMGNTIIAKQDIPTYKNKGDSEENGCVLKAGSEVMVVGTDNYSWVKLQDITTGDICWMKVMVGTYDTMIVGDNEYYITELFENVRQAG